MELFFDLVAVAGINQLAHLLHDEPGLPDFALYLVLYLAFWTAWACITLYSNIARDRTRQPLMLAAMFGLGVMGAAVAGIPDRHSTTFAAAYVLLRIGTAQVWGRGRIVVDWPVAQLTVGVLPWIVSLWVPEPWKYWLWTAGLVVDLWLMFAVSGERMLAGAQQALEGRLRRGRQERQGPRWRRFDGMETPKLVALHADPEHLGERLGLYVIIVLGEGFITAIGAVGAVAWTATVVLLGIGAFLLLAGLWASTLTCGFIPRLLENTHSGDRVPWQHVMAAHCAITGAIVTMAAALGLTISHAPHHLSAGIGWLLCGGAAAYFAVTAVAGLHARADLRAIRALSSPLCAHRGRPRILRAPHRPGDPGIRHCRVGRLGAAVADPGEGGNMIPGDLVAPSVTATDLTMYSTTWCGYCRRLKKQLDEAGITYEVIDIEDHPDAAEFVGSVNNGNHVVPTVKYRDGSTATNPSLVQVKEALAAIG